MKKIGLFLEAEPSGGGTFQYNQTMLEAVAALPRDRFSVVVGYTSALWQEYLMGYDLQTVFVPRGVWGRVLGQGWLLSGLPMGPWRKACPLFHPIAKVLLRQECDLWIFPSQDARSFQVPVPALVSIHDLMHRYERRFPEAGSRWQYLLRERHYSNICRFARGLLVDSVIGQQHVVESYGTPSGRTHVLPFIAPGYLRSAAASPGFDTRYRLPEKFIFYPAQFWEHKNHQRLIRAVAALKNELPDLKLVLAGSKKGAYPAVLKLVHDLNLMDDVLFLGYVPDADMAEFYRRARALVMPTYYGPTNIPPLEAFTVGCPVAISEIYGMPEQAGDAALLFNPDSLEEIAHSIRRLWSDDRLCAELVEKGARRGANWGQPQFNERLCEIVTGMVSAAEGSR
ncbi:glycosyltransferase family 4 protein [Trichloromonas sp.]|uniref:glycosyltransferase family 4 protein n=1 Tax=Trichloromonas sp. TaxID=3069249 RepID=UPI003D819E05